MELIRNNKEVELLLFGEIPLKAKRKRDEAEFVRRFNAYAREINYFLTDLHGSFPNVLFPPHSFLRKRGIPDFSIYTKDGLHIENAGFLFAGSFCRALADRIPTLS